VAAISRRAGSTAATAAVNLVTEDGTYIDQAEYDARVIADCYRETPKGRQRRGRSGDSVGDP